MRHVSEEMMEAIRRAMVRWYGAVVHAVALGALDQVAEPCRGAEIFAHHGTYEGRTMRGTPVYNCAQFVLREKFGKPYTLLEI